jgi:hypothetical protein
MFEKKNDGVSTRIFVLWIVGKASMKFLVIKSVEIVYMVTFGPVKYLDIDYGLRVLLF